MAKLNDKEKRLIIADNYQSHLEKREIAKHYQGYIQAAVIMAWRDLKLMGFPEPRLNEWGCDSYSWQEWTELISRASQIGLDASLILRWYWTEEAWAEFQEQWNQVDSAVNETVSKVVNKGQVKRRPAGTYTVGHLSTRIGILSTG